MKHSIGFSLAVLLLAGCAMAQPATNETPRDVTLTADSSVDDVLDALDARGKQMSDLSATVKLSEKDTALGLSSTRTGKLWLQRKTPADARIRVRFEEKITGKKTVPDKIEYALDDGWLTEQNFNKTSQIRRQVLRPGEKMDLFKLGEGPFPLPLGQNKADVKKMFEVKKLPAGKDDPANTVHLELKPNAGTKLARKFNSIGIWVDTRSRMPVRIETLDPNESSMHVTELGDLDTSTVLKDKDFAMEKVDLSNWQTFVEPFSD